MDSNEFPLADSLNNSILMHRDAHFSGDFDSMIEYYEKEGKGVSPDFDLDKIRELAELEKQSNENLAGILLTGPEAEQVAKSKNTYKALKDLYENNDPDKKYARLIADLILSEEENPEKEIQAIVQEKGAIVRSLIDLLKAEDFYDPLFPGYGHAPSLAAQCLGLIGDKRAIIALFESIGAGDFFDEAIALNALKTLGAPAKEFLLKVLHGKPLNEDNERAAIALVQFKDDPEVAAFCFQMLQDKDVLKDLPLSTYLVMACEHLDQTAFKDAFIAMSKDEKIPKTLRLDMNAIAREWT